MCREGRGTCFNIDLYRDALCKIGNEKCITTIGTVNSRLAHMPAIRTAAQFPAARLAQLGERRSAEREAVGSNPGRTNTQGL